MSVTALGLHHTRKRFKWSKALWYIACAALLLAFEGVCYKLLFERGVTVSTAIGGEAFVSLLLAFLLLFSPHMLRNITAGIPLFVTLSPLLLLEEFFTFLGLTSESYAISLTSLSVVKGITMASPFFLLLYAWLGGGFFPALFKEDLHRKMVLRKLLLFALLIIGIILVKE